MPALLAPAVPMVAPPSATHAADRDAALASAGTSALDRGDALGMNEPEPCSPSELGLPKSKLRQQLAAGSRSRWTGGVTGAGAGSRSRARRCRQPGPRPYDRGTGEPGRARRANPGSGRTCGISILLNDRLAAGRTGFAHAPESRERPVRSRPTAPSVSQQRLRWRKIRGHDARSTLPRRVAGRTGSQANEVRSCVRAFGASGPRRVCPPRERRSPTRTPAWRRHARPLTLRGPRRPCSNSVPDPAAWWYDRPRPDEGCALGQVLLRVARATGPVRARPVAPRPGTVHLPVTGPATVAG